MFMRVHRQGKEVIVALCDAELIGKVLKGGEAVLDLKKYGDFYKGEKVKVGGAGKAGKKGEAGADERKVAKALGEATSINAVGKKAVGLVSRELEVEPESVKSVGGVPHVQVYKV